MALVIAIVSGNSKSADKLPSSYPLIGKPFLLFLKYYMEHNIKQK